MKIILPLAEAEKFFPIISKIMADTGKSCGELLGMPCYSSAELIGEAYIIGELKLISLENKHE